MRSWFAAPTPEQQKEQLRQGWLKLFRDDPSAFPRVQACLRTQPQPLTKSSMQICANAETAYQNAKSAASVAAALNAAETQRRQQALDEQQRQEREYKDMLLGDLEGRVNRLEQGH